MNALQWIKSMLSLSRTDEAAQHAEFGPPEDPAFERVESGRIPHPESAAAQTADGVLSEFERPRDGTR